jgi:hypothetical protein
MAKASSWSWVTNSAVAGGLEDGAHLVRQALAQVHIQVGKRLVQQQQLRAGASARASATRCCWPPESSCGKRFSLPSRPTSSSTSATRARARPGRWWMPKPRCAHVQVREQRVVLEHHANAPLLGRHACGSWRCSPPAPGGSRRRHRLQPGHGAQQRGLAAARGADQHADVARTQAKRHAVAPLAGCGRRNALRSWETPETCNHCRCLQFSFAFRIIQVGRFPHAAERRLRQFLLLMLLGPAVLPVLAVLASWLPGATPANAPRSCARWRAPCCPTTSGPRCGLCLLVALGVALVGTATAAAVTLFDFPGRRTFEWALLLPLAMPAYVVAYAYTDFLQFSGPLQTGCAACRAGRARVLPEVRSLGVPAWVFTFALYPYVYLLARTALGERAAHLMEAARLLGAPLSRRILPPWPAAGPPGGGRWCGAGADGDAGRLRRVQLLWHPDLHHRHLQGLAVDGQPRGRGAVGHHAAGPGGHAAASWSTGRSGACALLPGRRPRRAAEAQPVRCAAGRGWPGWCARCRC